MACNCYSEDLKAPAPHSTTKNKIFKGTMTPADLAKFLEDISPQLISLQKQTEDGRQIISTTTEKYHIHEIKIQPHYIEVFLMSIEHSTERETHRFEMIDGKWKRTKRETYGIY
tara:strand:+ start:53 stop:394 length:342 start_codon:yes stop_codon:yes gene_type:complete